MAVFDIACLGTSLTAGTGTGYNGNRVFPGGMWQPALVRALAPGKVSDIRTYNLGLPGQNSSAGVATAWKVALLKPRVCTIEFSMNDSPAAQNISLAQSQANVEAIIATIRAGSPTTQIVLMTMNPVIAGTSGGDARANLPAYYQRYRNMVANDSSLLLVDNEPSWSGVGLAQIPDGIHPLLAEVDARLVPDVAAVIGPLIP